VSLGHALSRHLGTGLSYCRGISPHPSLASFPRQAVAQTASHAGTVTGPASGSTRLASALRLCSSALRGGALARGV
jgi:hypothetical protein